MQSKRFSNARRLHAPMTQRVRLIFSEDGALVIIDPRRHRIHLLPRTFPIVE